VAVTERYFLDQDNSSHWYVVPVARQEEWDAWCNLDEDDERAWEVPSWARPVNGSHQRVKFENPVIE
jgi:hypothetical protein